MRFSITIELKNHLFEVFGFCLAFFFVVHLPHQHCQNYQTGSWIKLLNIEDKYFELDRVQSPLAMISLLGKREQNSPGVYHLSTPPLFALALQLPLRLNGFLLEMQMFSWMTLLWNIVEGSPHSFADRGYANRPTAWAPALVWKHWGWRLLLSG